MNSIISFIKNNEKYIFYASLVFLTVFFSQNDNLEKKYIMVFGTLLIMAYLIINGIHSIPYREMLLLLLFGFYSYVKFEGNAIIYVPALFVIFSLLGYLLTKRNYERNNNVRYILYSLVIGYSFHMVMNGIYLVKLFVFDGGGSDFVHNRKWTDYLSHNSISATQQQVYFLPALAILFVAFIEKNKKIKALWFTVSFLALALSCLSFTRSPFLILFIVLFIQLITYLFFNHSKKIVNIIKKTIIVVVIVIFAAFILICSNFSNIKKQNWYNDISYTVSRGGGITHNVRVFFWIQAISQMDDYPYGGNRMELHYMIKTDNGYQIDYDRKPPEEVHNVWLDIYNAEGYLPFILLVIYTIITYIDLAKFVRNKLVDINLKLILLGMFIAFQFMYMVEPIFNVSYQLLIPWIFMDGIMYGINEKSKQLSKIGNTTDEK